MATNILLALGVIVGSLWSVLLWQTTKALRAHAALEGRVARLTEALTLLTDTTESGFRTIGEQMASRETAPAGKGAKASPRVRATTTGRVVRAARRGRSAAEIAATEQVSEGEVRLRMHLADALASARQEAKHGTLRAR